VPEAPGHRWHLAGNPDQLLAESRGRHGRDRDRQRREQGARQPAPAELLFPLADQWRAQAAGYAGDGNAKTPALDRLAAESVMFSHAVSCTPVCSPFRPTLVGEAA